MAESQLSVRSAKARDLAHRLARRENRSIADVVERALEAYEIREAGREPASTFYARLTASSGADIDLEKVIREGHGRRSRSGDSTQVGGVPFSASTAPAR
ncbi:type II toxin-antitoxin system VapB family antitoxin [Mesorhizobium sp. B2-4-12]|uniref:type II toxin-antitoxin system VapB family antitoxin n=1 Tax=Mesorhizobium sp. B2-4-12 TaxID=2589937 RepID=UPI001FEEF945|nr:type II toxin-antitoxin system VapB family antitoxin [Mesorhizobium sp. B2-4-12]